ncbi:SDR family NAD(P)-dependent oxidoreductase [Thiohalobacter thiocyanaticus]|uniref:SDR family NAD(P)-dependent oxidoreductase n=1 Tax=Thiohalobacter thiocyanaticus TaxID=585455 RepID=A0A426QFN4_9GAMM|nr:SDR family NAD(P)-dependent oxidoreductase [Thiohalobacter thiocyanaticus]RRQ20560.1 SDR family NAD(P)-dependent oxidoreductase [Thiohalobacter thiocyanaticus]
MKLFITGNSSGLGRGFSEAALGRGWEVYGCSRRGCGLDGVHDVQCDLGDFGNVPVALDQLLTGVERLDLVILNAGILGEIRPMHDTSLEELRRSMDINVWANKVILDWLLDAGIAIDQIVGISSGAAVLGNKGWNGYAISKAALNMVLRLYSHEFPNTHISAIAPGLIDTAMMDYLCVEPDPEEFPALGRIREARGTQTMPGPREAAERVLGVVGKLREFDSGSFVDIRQLIAPEEYAALMRAPASSLP